MNPLVTGSFPTIGGGFRAQRARDTESVSMLGDRHAVQRHDILLSTLTSVANDLFNYALRLDNELSARPPRGRHGL